MRRLIGVMRHRCRNQDRDRSPMRRLDRWVPSFVATRRLSRGASITCAIHAATNGGSVAITNASYATSVNWSVCESTSARIPAVGQKRAIIWMVCWSAWSITIVNWLLVTCRAFRRGGTTGARNLVCSPERGSPVVSPCYTTHKDEGGRMKDEIATAVHPSSFKRGRDNAAIHAVLQDEMPWPCLLYTSPSPRDGLLSRMPSSA